MHIIFWLEVCLDINHGCSDLEYQSRFLFISYIVLFIFWLIIFWLKVCLDINHGCSKFEYQFRFLLGVSLFLNSCYFLAEVYNWKPWSPLIGLVPTKVFRVSYAQQNSVQVRKKFERGQSKMISVTQIHLFTSCSYPVLNPEELPSLTTSHRPISLINSIMKVFERVIKQRLRSHLEQIEFINKHQSRFRRAKSTNDLLFRQSQSIMESFNRGEHL